MHWYCARRGCVRNSNASFNDDHSQLSPTRPYRAAQAMVLVDTRPSPPSDQGTKLGRAAPGSSHRRLGVTLASMGDSEDMLSFLTNASNWPGPKVQFSRPLAEMLSKRRFCGEMLTLTRWCEFASYLFDAACCVVLEVAGEICSCQVRKSLHPLLTTAERALQRASTYCSRPRLAGALRQ